jgi:periplasmic protein TonB
MPAEPMASLTSTDLPAERGTHRPSGLLAAFLVALILHVLVLSAAMFLRLAPPAPPGEQQITVDLAPVMTDAATEAPAEQQMSQAAPPETKPVDLPPDDAPQPPPPEMTEVKPEETQVAAEPPPQAEPVEPQGQVITSTSEAAEPLAPPPAEIAKAEEPPKPTPDPAKVKAERDAKLKKIREEKLREEARQERLEEIREAKAKAAREAKARQAKAQEGAEARNSASASRQNAAGRAAAGSDPSALRQWTGAISAAIHGRMNPGAAAGTSGGTAMVRFTVMRSGQVTGAGLARSSGVGQIDSAALSAVRGSLPAAPPGVTQSSLSVTIPLNYRVR